MSSILIGIAGGTCSGKTTLASALQERLGSRNCTLLQMDDFYIQQPDDLLASGAVNFERPEAFDFESFVTAIEFLRAGREIDIPDYDRMSSRIQGLKTLSPRRMLIIEGLFVFMSERLRELLNLAIFLEVESAISLSRRVKRDVCDYGLSPHSVHQRYHQNVVPAHCEFVAPMKARADLVLSGTLTIDQLLATILSRLDDEKLLGLITVQK